MKNTRLQAISRRASPILSDLGSPPHMESPPELPPLHLSDRFFVQIPYLLIYIGDNVRFKFGIPNLRIMHFLVLLGTLFAFAFCFITSLCQITLSWSDNLYVSNDVLV